MGSFQVKDVRHFAFDRVDVDDYGNATVSTVIRDGVDGEVLAWFKTPCAAAKVLNMICRALSLGKCYFDLNAYDEDGNTEEGPAC